MNKCVVGINEVDFGSTGTIAKHVLSYLSNKGYETYFATSFPTVQNENTYQISVSKITYTFNKILCRFAATDGFHSKKATRKLVEFLEVKKPGYLFINNLHGGYINLEILFDYIKKNDVKVVWTLHDCWPFTGKCSYFAYENCTKWKESCGNCPCLHEHPRAYLFDKSRELLAKKKELFSGLENKITFVCPSQWVLDQVKQSLLKNFTAIVINNGLAENCEIEDCSTLFDKNRIANRLVLFSAGMPLGARKGIHILNKLAEELDPNEYAIIVAGADEKRFKLHDNLINVGFLNSRAKMNYFYNFADAYLNTSLDDTYGMVLAESQFMGTPVISFNTGGCKDTFDLSNGNVLVEYNNYDALKKAIISFKPKKYSNEQIKTYIKDHSIDLMCEKYYHLF